MNKIITNLTEEDYENLKFETFVSKDKYKIEQRQRTYWRLCPTHKKLIILEIEGKEFLGKIEALSLTTAYGPTNYKAKKWELPIHTVFKIYVDIDKKYKDIIVNMGEDVIIDNIEYYMGNFKSVGDEMKFEFVSYDSFDSKRKENI